MRWSIQAVDPQAVARLARELRVTPLVARLLVLRGLEDPAAAERFLHPSLEHLHDPFLMADMPAAVARLRRAVEQGEKILIYGDYDVDGTMAVVVLLHALGTQGAKVEAYVPHRLTDGYGMRAAVVERAAREGCSLVISVDTGIREHEVIARARELGVECIVTDHHLPEGHLPPACAILNPRRADCAYPEKNLSGVGVAFKLAQALLGPALSDGVLRSYLKVVAIGTIADVVPLLGENRAIAKFGLEALSSAGSEGKGLEALLETAQLQGRAVSAWDVAFRIAPRLNAAGRMEDARDVITLLTTSDAAQARAIAWRLDDLNRARQRVEGQILGEILENVERSPQVAEGYSLVFSRAGWHRGVIGIVAQRVVDRFHRPCLVIAVEDGVGYGSGRSIRGFHLLDALTDSRHLFERFGGHAQAAGFALPAERIGELEARFEAFARAHLSPQDFEPTLRVDAEVELAALDFELYEQLRNLEPFGFGNPAPVFASSAVLLAAPPRILKEKHLKLRVSQGAKTFDALAWDRARDATELPAGGRVDLAFTLNENSYQGIVTLQLMAKDFWPSAIGERVGERSSISSEA